MSSAPPQDWGTAGVPSFVSTHTDPTPALDPRNVQLPPNFTVCVVGASRGIGAGVAVSYARAGAGTIYLASRRISGLEATATACQEACPKIGGAAAGIKTEIVACDIAEAGSVAALAETIRAGQNGGNLDVVVVNSGFSGPVVLKLTDTDPETFQRATNVNYVGTFHCAKYLIPLLLETRDRRRDDGVAGAERYDGVPAFVGIGSWATLLVRGMIANAQYCVSKAAQTKLMEHVHEQYVGEGLAVYTVHPGAVRSEMAEETAPEEFMKHLTDSPELAGAFCVWLTKDGGKRDWLAGRLISACWDTEELEARREEILRKDMFKLRMTL